MTSIRIKIPEQFFLAWQNYPYKLNDSYTDRRQITEVLFFSGIAAEKNLKMIGRVKYRRRLRPVSTMTYILGSHQSYGVVLVPFELTCPAGPKNDSTIFWTYGGSLIC